MSVTGPFVKLEQIAAALRSVGSGALNKTISQQCAQAAVTEVSLGFTESRDPYGAGWAALKRRSGKPLRDTGRLGNSFQAKSITDSGFTVGSNVVYGGYHQSGTSRMDGTSRIVARPMTPERGLPESWAESFAEVAGEILAEKLGGSK